MYLKMLNYHYIPRRNPPSSKSSVFVYFSTKNIMTTSQTTKGVLGRTYEGGGGLIYALKLCPYLNIGLLLCLVEFQWKPNYYTYKDNAVHSITGICDAFWQIT